jgi:hypothetical protein
MVPEPATGSGSRDLRPEYMRGCYMGKYKQWLHHQEIGRRLRDQINTLEQERARVQKMAPSHPTTLPELENPLIAALLSYTRAGNRLSNFDVIKAAIPTMGQSNPDQRRPAGNMAPPNAGHGAGAGMTPQGSDAGVVASLLARADQIPADPLDQMRKLSQTKDQ